MIRVLFNRKGGVGKSSLTVNLAAIAAAQGLRTLVVDLDTQCNSSHYLQQNEGQSPDIAALFEQHITFHLRREPCAYFCAPTPVKNLDLLPGSTRLATLESELHSRHKIYKLKEALDEAREDYQRIYIDTPPALNFYTLSALIAADNCLIPIDCDDFARQGLYNLEQQIGEIREDHNAKLQIEGIIANQFQVGAKLPQQIVDELTKEGYPVLPVMIGQSVKMRESHQARKPLIQMAPKHKLTQSLLALHDAIEA